MKSPNLEYIARNGETGVYAREVISDPLEVITISISEKNIPRAYEDAWNLIREDQTYSTLRKIMARFAKSGYNPTGRMMKTLYLLRKSLVNEAKARSRGNELVNKLYSYVDKLKEEGKQERNLRKLRKETTKDFNALVKLHRYCDIYYSVIILKGEFSKTCYEIPKSIPDSIFEFPKQIRVEQYKFQKKE